MKRQCICGRRWNSKKQRYNHTLKNVYLIPEPRNTEMEFLGHKPCKYFGKFFSKYKIFIKLILDVHLVSLQRLSHVTWFRKESGQVSQIQSHHQHKTRVKSNSVPVDAY